VVFPVAREAAQHELAAQLGERGLDVLLEEVLERLASSSDGGGGGDGMADDEWSWRCERSRPRGRGETRRRACCANERLSAEAGAPRSVHTIRGTSDAARGGWQQWGRAASGAVISRESRERRREEEAVDPKPPLRLFEEGRPCTIKRAAGGAWAED
jgi:hypothetical protein